MTLRTFNVEVEKRWNTPLGVPDGTVVFHVMERMPYSGAFSGCPLGRGATEAAALRDFVRPGYALPYDTDITVANLVVVERKDSATAEVLAYYKKGG